MPGGRLRTVRAHLSRVLPKLVGEIAQQQHGVVAWSQVAARGVPRHRWDSAVRAGVLIRVATGIGRFAGAPPTDLQRVMTAVLSAGPTAFASHRTAARLWGVEVAPWRPIDLTVAGRAYLAARDGVVIHRPRVAPQHHRTRRFGIPTAHPLTVLHQLGAVAPVLLPIAFEHFVVAGIVNPATVEQSLDRRSTAGQPGIAVLRKTLRTWLFADRPPDSVLEIRVAEHLAQRGMTGWEAQVRIGSYRVDFAHRPTRTVLEVDGWAYHGYRHAFDADRQRDAALASNGWLVVRTTWRQIVDAPDATFQRLQNVLTVRTGRVE